MDSLDPNAEFEVLLDYLKHVRGCDLTGYKRGTLVRRFQHRMRSVNIDNYSEYLRYLQLHSQEYLALIDDLLINLTSFFRDRDVWDCLTTEIIPEIIASKKPDETIRVWSAGCSAGQELYSLVILFAEALGIETCTRRVQCFGTDLDEDAIQQARRAVYGNLDIADVPLPLLQKYFIQTKQGYIFRSELRKKVIFGRHDLAEDAPMSKIDLLLCRNVLIYFNPEVQESILARFHFALNKTGLLCLGRTEILTHRKQLFVPFHLKQRIYTKRSTELELSEYHSLMPKSREKLAFNSLATQSHFWKTAFEDSPVAQIAVNMSDRLVAVNERATLLFGLTSGQWESPFRELEPGRLIAAHIAVKTLYRSRTSMLLKNIEWESSTHTRYFDITIAPVFNPEGRPLGIVATFLEAENRSPE